MKTPDDRLPPQEIKRIWNDPEELERWTNEQLGPRFDPDEIGLSERNFAILMGMGAIKDAIAQGDADTVLRLIANDEVLNELAPEVDITFERIAVLPEQIRRWRLPSRPTTPTKRSDSRAARFGSDDAIAPVLRRYAIRELMHKHADIRQRLPYDLKERAQAAVMEVDRIHEIWWRKLGKRYRGDRRPPTAIQIAARRWDVSERLLLSQKKNRARDEPPWFAKFWRHRYSVY
jgi:hypothetical protein